MRPVLELSLEPLRKPSHYPERFFYWWGVHPTSHGMKECSTVRNVKKEQRSDLLAFQIEKDRKELALLQKRVQEAIRERQRPGLLCGVNTPFISRGTV